MTTIAPVNANPSVHRRAYVVDDEAGVRKFICRGLAQSGYDAQAFDALHPLLLAVRTEPPELIVLDLALGGSDAIEVIRHLEILKYRGRVLLITGRDESTLSQVYAVGKTRGLAMLPPLTKPFLLGDLATRLTLEPETSARSEDSPPESPRVDLGEALGQKWLQLWYQPKIDLKSLQVSGAEALLRAEHPRHGVLGPRNLLPNAGDPLHEQLAMFVLRQVSADWACMADAGRPGLKLAVNIPVSVVHAPTFVTTVRAMIPSDPRFPGLVVEVTEDEIIRDPDLVRETAAQLRLYGVILSIDDFGSGYSSLARLRDLPCGELKLDRSFVSGCGADPLKAAVCQMVADLAHRFGVEVCAEGVETTDELRALKDMGFDTAQGFLFSPAVPLPRLIEKITRMAPIASSSAP